MGEFAAVTQEVLGFIEDWEHRLLGIPDEVLASRRNAQGRTVKQILGHLVDSATNNTHRIVHLQYQASPLSFPNYASLGNNDRWIAIQNYEHEEWYSLVQLWCYANQHIVHVIGSVSEDKLGNEWIAGPDQVVSLREMILDYPRHLEDHLQEISELLG